MTQEEKIEKIASHIKAIIELMGEDPSREGLLKTPLRSAKALAYLTSGYAQDASQMIGQAVFGHEGSRLVTVKDIEFYSMCEHHILPFFGKVAIGYIPDGKIVGLSKLARIVNVYARRLQVQERLTAEIAQELQRTLKPKGVIVVCDAQHMCMKMRGVEKQESSTATVEYTGVFEESAELREEFFRSLGL
ncbi:MAG: GTP cyclohydrolase I FolE [Clostridium sp.]|nr:GTP cyclohydrolase I FolE [Clostridium sp.]